MTFLVDTDLLHLSFTYKKKKRCNVLNGNISFDNIIEVTEDKMIE